MTDRIPLDHLTSDQYDELCDQLDALQQIARGYCPDCGRGDAAPTVADWEQQKQRADQAEAAFTRLREARDRIAHAPGHVDAIWCLDQLDAALAEAAVERAEAAADRIRRLTVLIRRGAPWVANRDDLADRIEGALDGEQPGPVTAQATGRSDPGTEPTQPAAAYQQLLARLETEHAKSIHNATHATRDDTRLSLDGIAAGLHIAIAHALTVFEGHEARQAWMVRRQQAADGDRATAQATEPAHNDGPTVREAAADDRRWPLQKTGE